MTRRQSPAPLARALTLTLLLYLAAAGAGLLPAQETLAQETDAGAADSGVEEVVVRGFAVNGTAGGAIPADRPITLHTIDRTAGRVATAETTTDPAGGFRFEDVPLLEGRSYVLVMDYAGMRYNSRLEPAALAEPVELTVYETTRELSAVQVERQTMVIAGVNEKEREIAALELLHLNNAGDRTLLPELTNITDPGAISFLRFSLPDAARELDVQSTLPGGDIVAIGNGFAVTAPVMPGEHQINYTYTFPYQGDRVAFNQRLLQGAGVYQILVPEELAAIQITPLEPRPRIDVAGQVYLVWEGREIPPGRGIMLELSRLPQPGPLSRLAQAVADGNLWETVIPIMLGIALAALLVYAWFRGARKVPATGPATIPNTVPSPATAILSNPVPNAVSAGDAGVNAEAAGPDPARRQALVQSIALLDDRFERGLVSEGDYQSRRAGLLAQLRQPIAEDRAVSPANNPAGNPANNPAGEPAGADPERDA